MPDSYNGHAQAQRASYFKKEMFKFKQIRRRELHKTVIGFNEEKMTLHVRYKFWYISSPSSA